MKKEQKEYKINQLLTLLLFTVFTICILFVLLTGAGIYKQLTEKNQNCYDKRTAVQYLTTRVRQNDKNNLIEIRQFGENEALILKEKIHETEYETVIYCYDGYLREIFSSSVDEFSPEDGNKILKMKHLMLEKNDDMIYAEIIDIEGTVQRIELFLRSGEAVIYEK